MAEEKGSGMKLEINIGWFVAILLSLWGIGALSKWGWDEYRKKNPKKNNGGNTVTNTDGSITVTGTDGTKVTTFLNGNVTTVSPDGTTTTVNAAGETI